MVHLRRLLLLLAADLHGNSELMANRGNRRRLRVGRQGRSLHRDRSGSGEIIGGELRKTVIGSGSGGRRSGEQRGSGSKLAFLGLEPADQGADLVELGCELPAEVARLVLAPGGETAGDYAALAIGEALRLEA